MVRFFIVMCAVFISFTSTAMQDTAALVSAYYAVGKYSLTNFQKEHESYHKPFKFLESRYRQLFLQSRREIIDEFIQLFGMSKNSWRRFRNKQKGKTDAEEHEVKTKAENVVAHTMPFVHETTAKLALLSGLDPQVVTLKVIDDPKATVLCSDEKTIFLNKPKFSSICKNAHQQNVWLLHELHHIANNDVLDCHCIKLKIKEKKTQLLAKQEKIYDLCEQLAHLQEQRADILAGLADIECVKAEIAIIERDFLEKDYESSEVKKTLETAEKVLYEHPSWHARHKYMKRLYREMRLELRNDKKEVKFQKLAGSKRRLDGGYVPDAEVADTRDTKKPKLDDAVQGSAS